MELQVCDLVFFLQLIETSEAPVFSLPFRGRICSSSIPSQSTLSSGEDVDLAITEKLQKCDVPTMRTKIMFIGLRSGRLLKQKCISLSLCRTTEYLQLVRLSIILC